MDDASTKYKTIHKGQNVFREGQPATVAYMLKQGKVTLYRVLHNKRVVLSSILPGQIFGEEGLLKGQSRIASAEAEEPCELIVIDSQVFQTMLLKCPAPLQRLTRYLIEQVRALHENICERPTSSMFMSVCGIIDMAYRTHVNLPQSARGANWAMGMSYAELSRTLKEILLVTQLEIDDVVGKLSKLKFVEVAEDTKAVMKKDVLGKMVKTADFLQDRYLRIPELDKFLGVARNLQQEMQSENTPLTESLEFIDIFGFAEMVKSTPEMIYKKISYKEIPENLFFLHKQSAEAYAKQMGEEFFQRVKRRRVAVEDLEGINDVVFVDNATLEQAFERVGFHKLAMLVKVAGEEARDKILQNLSKKMSKVVTDEAKDMENLDDMEVADAEDELIAAIKDIKGLNK
jgi:CRP-like cAMP-binding protein